MKRLDPYEELDVPKDATDEQIKAAAKVAYKRTHPDVGGDVDSFGRARLSELVLLDPEKRKKFDRTGDVDEEKPDNRRASALQVIEAFLAPLVTDYLGSGLLPQKDPRRRDLFAEFRAKMQMETATLEQQIEQTKATIEFLRDFRSRFDGDDPASPIERSIDRQIDHSQKMIGAHTDGIDMRRAALEIVDKYRFRGDPPPAPSAGSGNTASGGWPTFVIRTL